MAMRQEAIEMQEYERLPFETLTVRRVLHEPCRVTIFQQAIHGEIKLQYYPLLTGGVFGEDTIFAFSPVQGFKGLKAGDFVANGYFHSSGALGDLDYCHMGHTDLCLLSIGRYFLSDLTGKKAMIAWHLDFELALTTPAENGVLQKLTVFPYTSCWEEDKP